jgi:hypothetical protein
MWEKEKKQDKEEGRENIGGEDGDTEDGKEKDSEDDCCGRLSKTMLVPTRRVRRGGTTAIVLNLEDKGEMALFPTVTDKEDTEDA